MVMLDDGTLVSRDIDYIKKITVFRIPYKLLEIEKMLKSQLPKDGIYFRNNERPFIQFGDRFFNKNGNVIIINSLSDFINFIKDGNKYVDKDISITKQNINNIKKHLYEVYNYNVLLKPLLEYMESDIMVNEHNEAMFVESDPLGISNHILLAYPYARINQTLESHLSNIRYDILNDISKEYSHFRSQIIDTIGLHNNNNSIYIELKNNMVEVIEYDSPSSRRYKLNLELMKEMVEVIDDSSNNKRYILKVDLTDKFKD